MARTYTLRDVEAVHRTYPRTFSIPRGEVRRNLESGWFVKLVFELPRVADDGCDAERMWCEVIRRRGRGFVGRLDNTPRLVRRLAKDAEVRFEACHVAALERGDQRRLGPLVGVGIDVLRLSRWPTWIARVAPACPPDSGWRVFSAREAREGATVRAVSTSTLFHSWAVTDSAIEPATDGVWRWDRAAREYVQAAALPRRLLPAAAEGLGRLHGPAPAPDQLVVITRRALKKSPTRAQYFGVTTKRPDDSGWAIYAGDEPRRELQDPTQSTVESIGRVLHAYPYLERVLGETRRTTWVWDELAADWRIATRPRAKSR